MMADRRIYVGNERWGFLVFDKFVPQWKLFHYYDIFKLFFNADEEKLL